LITSPVSYDFYSCQYRGGSIPLDAWPLYARRASEELNRLERVYTVTVPNGAENAEEMAVCAIADALYYFSAVANGETGAVSSAKIGSVSVSYGGDTSKVDLSPAGQAREIYRVASVYLDIYRGVGAC